MAVMCALVALTALVIFCDFYLYTHSDTQSYLAPAVAVTSGMANLLLGAIALFTPLVPESKIAGMVIGVSGLISLPSVIYIGVVILLERGHKLETGSS